jgi:hypothetical protein
MTAEAENSPQEDPVVMKSNRRYTMAFLGVAGVLLIALGVIYQPFGSEPEIADYKPVQTNMKNKMEFTIDSATGKVEEQAGGELRQLLSLVERERKEPRDARRLSSKSEGKGKGGKSSKSRSEMPSTAPTISPAPSVSSEPTSPTTMPSVMPTMEGSPFGRTPAPTVSPAPSVSSEPTAPTVSPAPSNQPTGSKGSKSGKGKGKGSSSKSGKSRRDRDRRLRELMEEAEQAEKSTFKTGRRQLS